MSGSGGYIYVVRRAPVALTTAITLLQVKAGAAPLDLVDIAVYQLTKTTTEFLALQILRKTAAATVTAFTPLKANPGDPAALAIGGTAATGITATAEGTDGDILEEDIWNVLNGSWRFLDIPEGRLRVPQAGIIAVKLNTAPAASMTVGCVARFIEYQ